MDVAFYSERSIEDELARESSGDVTTILISYVIMFIYVTISLGTVTTWKRVMVSKTESARKCVSACASHFRVL